MNRKLIGVLALVFLCVTTLVTTVSAGQTRFAQVADFNFPKQTEPETNPQPLDQDISTACALQPERKRGKNSAAQAAIARAPLGLTSGSVTLSRFRRDSDDGEEGNPLTHSFTKLATPYKPKEEIALIHPTNFGDRFLKDINGKPALYEPIVVLHETVGSASSAIGFFQTPHPRDDDQASYHSLIRRNGTVVYLVPPDKRAFGAGNSSFKGVSVRTNPSLPGSVNNFAYHVSLETPADGNNNGYSHSGYTEAQYRSLAWLIAKTGIPEEHITTHRAVDRSSSRIDPRSFKLQRLTTLLKTFPRTEAISIRCTEPLEMAQ